MERREERERKRRREMMREWVGKERQERDATGVVLESHILTSQKRPPLTIGKKLGLK